MPLTQVSPGMLNTQASAQGFKNRIINGDCRVFQRGTNATTNNSTAYYIDRMWGFSSNTAATFSQVSSTGLEGFPNALRAQRDAGNAGVNGVYTGQIVESRNMQDLQGQTVTVSFYARAGANYSPTGSALSVDMRTGTVADQGVAQLLAGWTGQVSQSSSVTLTTSWQRFSATFSVASNALELAVFFTAIGVGTAGAADYFDVTGIQLEVGPTATTFERLDYGRQLIQCQRYYYRMFPGFPNAIFGSGFNSNTTVAGISGSFPVAMRTRPSALEQSGTAADYTVAYLTTGTVCSSVPTFDGPTTSYMYAVLFTVASGLTAGQACQARTSSNSTGYLAWSAEL